MALKVMTGSINDPSKHFNNITLWPILSACVFAHFIMSTEYAGQFAFCVFVSDKRS